jgi:uncharacterized protein
MTDTTADIRDRLIATRRAISDKVSAAQLAYSTDGRSFEFQGPIITPLASGGYVLITTIDGRMYLGQVEEKHAERGDGPELTLDGDAGLGVDGVNARVLSTTFRIPTRAATGSGAILGRIEGDRVVACDQTDVFADAAIAPADGPAVDRFFAARTAGKTTLDIGYVMTGAPRPAARVLAGGFDRHTFLCGQSGSGKTYSLGVLLERLLLETTLPMIILDPNSDFVKLGEVRDAAAAQRGFREGWDPAAFAEMQARYRRATEKVRVLRATPRGTRSDHALRIRFSDLQSVAQGLVLQLDPVADREEFAAFTAIVDRLGTPAYSLRDVLEAARKDLSHDSRAIALRIANLGVAEWDVWAERDEPTLIDAHQAGWRGLVLDIGGFTRKEEKSLVAAYVLGGMWMMRERREPVLIVIDEAHNVCPAQPDDPFQALATERAVTIAGEGRKFGLYLLASTQRPQKLHPNVLSQCDNLVLMRMNSASDIASLRETFSFVPAGLIDRAATFAQGESLIAGKLAPAPLLAAFGGRVSPEGGGDVPATWAEQSS